MKKKFEIVRPTDEENVIINRGIVQDEDNPEWTEEDFARARPAREVLPELLDMEPAEEELRRPPKFPRSKPLKTRVTLTLDADLLEWLKQQGPGYQHRINRILRQAMLAGRDET